jgi:hypothetical protein
MLLIGLVLFGSAGAALAMGATPARAAGVVGTGTPGSCTEAALDAALATGGGVSFNCGPAVHTITTTSAKTIDTPTQIDGGNKIILDGQDSHRLFVSNSALALSNIVLTGGYVAGSDGGAILHLSTEDELVLTNVTIRDSQSTDSGGAIASYGPTTLTDSVLENNQALNGGALYARYAGAQVQLYSSVLYNNRATGTTNGAGLGGGMLIFEGATAYVETGEIYSNTARQGGGVYVFPYARLETAEQAHIHINRAGIGGGGIYVAANANLHLANTTLSENVANEFGEDNNFVDILGGGALNAGTATLINVTLSDNGAEGGGGLANVGGLATLTNVTLYSNAAQRGAGILGHTGVLTLTHVTFDGNQAVEGGGLYNTALFGVGRVTGTHVTLNDNYAGSDGGGLYNLDGTVSLTHATFSDNRADVYQGSGGGVFNGASATTELTDASFSGNSANERGGGLYNYGGDVELYQVTFSGNGASADGGALANWGGSVSLNHGTISGNWSGYGGGVYNLEGSTNLSNVSLKGNSAARGGGLYNEEGTVTLGNVTVRGNQAVSDGGGLYNETGSTILLSNVTVSDNTAGDDGGGLYHAGSSLIVVSVTLHNNNAGDSGGGLLNNGTAVLMGVTLSENSAVLGGGQYNEGGTATVDNTTLSGNSADQGGGLYNYSGTTNLTNVTVHGNSGSHDGGGILLDGGTVTARNSIVANSPAGGNCFGTPTNNGFNLADDTTCGFTEVANVLLGPLTFNGGPTLTHLPLAGSPAINFVASGCPPPATDQRGAVRPVGGLCDAGAVEFGAVLPMVYIPVINK